MSGAKKLFYSSSACIYPKEIQVKTDHPGLKESDAWPANPDSDYGVEKIFSERLYLAYARNYGLNIRIARFHNIYGPNSPFDGERAKAPAAMCRKVIEAKNMIDVWGSGKQTRSFLYIDDCIDAVRLLMGSDFKEPINIGSEEMISINGLAQMAIDISGKHLVINNINGPVGVMGRNSNNDLIRKELGWEPKFLLRQGMERTFSWIKSQNRWDTKVTV
jgi:nucleoside-diphosphate-sugar epimerase